MSVTRKLSVNGADLFINQPFLYAEIAIHRAYQVDTFVTAVDFKQKVFDIENNLFETQLLPNTFGSFYEIVLFGAQDTKLWQCFFVMPNIDSTLYDLSTATDSYIDINAISTSFLQLSDTPNSYRGKGGKIVVVNEDGSGLEFVNCCGVLDPVYLCDEDNEFDLILFDGDLAKFLIEEGI
ncbi:hypothetical protein [Acinetobacter modestus]|uniref:hypothetical protein n=1 Tax=Acinetobacter modestus TaxID=1776740 RepID=UPI003017D55D